MKYKSDDYKLNAVDYHLTEDKSQEVFKKYTGIFAILVYGVVEWDLYEKGGINTDRLIKGSEWYTQILISPIFSLNHQPHGLILSISQY